jgi:hypothetical protein
LKAVWAVRPNATKESMQVRALLCVSLLSATSLAASAADDINQINLLTQAEFRDLSSDLSAAVSYKAVVPIEALGITGFDLGAEVTATRLAHRSAWDSASSGGAPSTVYIPKIHLHKGLPAGFDLGAFYATSPDTNINVWGAELRYALIAGGAATPAVGLRGTYSKLSGVDQISLNTKGVELGISKGFGFLTPYAGIGRIWTESAPVGPAIATAEKFADTKIYLGANINFGLGNVALEADKIGDTRSTSVKLGFRF